MLCPLCHRPFVATPTPAAPLPATPEEEMPVTARARSRQASPAKIILIVVGGILCIAICIPLLICMGIGSRVQHHQAEIAKRQEGLSKAARMAFVEQGYVDVRLQGRPSQHELGYQAQATGIDKWAKKHQLSMVFRYDGQLIEVLMLKEGERYKVASEIFEQWNGE